MNPDLESVVEYKSPKTLPELKRMVEQHLDLTRNNADEAKLDRDYYDGDQISDKTRALLTKRGQPPIYVNKISGAIRGILGVMDSADSDPEAFPRTASSRDAADVVTKVLRYLADRAEFKKVKASCSENYLIEGCCAAIVEFDGHSISVNQIAWEDFVYDPLSKKHDFSDAKFLGVAKMMDRSDVAALYPDLYDGSGSDDFGSFNDENAKDKFWGRSDRRLIRVCDIYYMHMGQWHRCVFTSSQVLYEGKSEALDDQGATICPIIAASFEVSRSGDRYGRVRDMRPLQDEVNARRSRMLHLTNHRQVQQSELNAPPANRAIAIREAARADGALPYGWAAIPAPDLAQGQMLLLQQATTELDRMAPTPAVLSHMTGNQSGRSRQILQQAGYTELARAFGRFEQFENECYRKLWFSARQHLDEPMEIRIADDPRAPEFLLINEPVMGMVAQPVMDESGQPQMDPMTGQPAMEIKPGVVAHKNRIAQLDMDIIISTVPDTVTLQQEAFNAILEYATGLKMSPLAPEFELLIEMSPIPNKREIIDQLQSFRAQMASKQQPDPMAEQFKALELDGKRAEIAKDRAKAMKDLTAARHQNSETMQQAFGFGAGLGRNPGSD